MTGDGLQDRADAGNSDPDAFPTAPLPDVAVPDPGTRATLPLPDPGTYPTLPLPPTEQATVAPARRRRRWPWFVALGVTVVLLVVGVLIAEQFARSVTVATIRTQIISQLGLPADQQLDVEVPGMVLPQLIGGTLGEVQISADEVAFGDLSAAIEVTATGVPIRGDVAAESARATVAVDQEQLRALLARVDGIPSETVTIDGDTVGMVAELDLFVTTVEVGITLGATVEEGELVLSPDGLSVAGVELSADALLQQFGPLAQSLLGSWTVCVADRMPAGVRLDAVTVADGRVVAALDIDGAIITDPTLRQPGTCS